MLVILKFCFFLNAYKEEIFKEIMSLAEGRQLFLFKKFCLKNKIEKL